MVLRKWLSSFVSRQLPSNQKPRARRVRLNQSQQIGQQAAAQMESLETRQLLTAPTDEIAPNMPVVSSPNSAMLTNAANVTIAGSAEAGSLVRLYRDSDGSGTVNAGDTFLNSQQLGTGTTAFSMSAALTTNAVNHLLVTATDAAGNVSAARAVPSITQDSIRPTPSLSHSAASYTNAASVAASVSFTEGVVGFTAGDVSVSNGTVSNFVAVDRSHYTFHVSPTSDGTVTINIAAGVATDAAGNPNKVATPVSFVSDRTAPAITINPSVAKNANGWNNTDVTVSYSVAEANVDPSLSDSTPDVLTASGTASATVTDRAGNSTTVSYSTLIDKIAPTLAAFRDSAANANGWNNSDVTVTFEASDNLSGGFSTPATQVFGEGSDQTASATVTDLAGNSTSVSIEHINVDKTAPTLTATRSANANANGWNNTDVTVTFESSDNLSGGFRENVPRAAQWMEGDLRDHSFVAALFAGRSYSYVYHLGAYAAEGLSHFVRRFNYQTNLVASVNLINESVRTGVQSFVFASSIAAYGLPDNDTRRKAGRVREDDWNKPITMYGCNKLYCEHLGRYFTQHFRQLGALASAARLDFRSLRFPGLISAETVRRAVAVAEWYGYEAERIYTMLDGDESKQEKAEKPTLQLVKWIEQRGGTVTARELSRGPREYRGDPERAAKALGELVATGVAVWVHDELGPKGGRPKDRIRLVSPCGDTGAGDETPANAANGVGSGTLGTVAKPTEAGDGWGEL